jgi:hypothetical protein
MRQCPARLGAFLDEAIRPANFAVAQQLIGVLAKPLCYRIVTELPGYPPSRGGFLQDPRQPPPEAHGVGHVP